MNSHVPHLLTLNRHCISDICILKQAGAGFQLP